MKYNDDIFLGDTCEVVYAGADPSMNYCLKDGNGNIILHHPRFERSRELDRMRENRRANTGIATDSATHRLF